jgi:hypothetical protein
MRWLTEKFLLAKDIESRSSKQQPVTVLTEFGVHKTVHRDIFLQ